MQQAKLIFHSKFIYKDGAIREMVLWLLPKPLAGEPHSFKYRLYYGCKGFCSVRFDNERGKGGHYHIRDIERPYSFESPEKLVDDFMEEIRKVREVSSDQKC